MHPLSLTEYPAELSARSWEDVVRARCRGEPDHGQPALFTRMVGESVLFNRVALFLRWIDGFELCRSEMMFGLRSPSCYPCRAFAALIARFWRFPEFMFVFAIRPNGSLQPRLGDWARGNQANGMSAGG